MFVLFFCLMLFPRSTIMGHGPECWILEPGLWILTGSKTSLQTHNFGSWSWVVDIGARLLNPDIMHWACMKWSSPLQAVSANHVLHVSINNAIQPYKNTNNSMNAA